MSDKHVILTAVEEAKLADLPLTYIATARLPYEVCKKIYRKSYNPHCSRVICENTHANATIQSIKIKCMRTLIFSM